MSVLQWAPMSKRRLARVYRYWKRRGVAVQYSVFLVPATHLEIKQWLEEVRDILNEKKDDVRAYLIPDRCRMTSLGRQSLPEGS